jgi:glycerophosphoryl diester phosphodiesterase
MEPVRIPVPAGRPLLLGHRGASADAPENTLAAFRRALEQGADGFELDVWRCGSGEAVVLHDVDTRRTAGVPADVRRTPLRQLRELDVGKWRGEAFRGERIPTLVEVLDAFPAAVVNVELKVARVPDPGLAIAVARAIRQHRAERRVVVSSFGAAQLALFRALAPDVPAGFLVSPGRGWQVRAAAAVRLLRPSAIHVARELVTGPRVSAWKGAGLQVLVWTGDDVEEALRDAALGVDVLVSNAPGRLATLLPVR